jgi:hypothetical protein
VLAFVAALGVAGSGLASQARADELEGRRLLELAVHARDEGRLEEARELLVRSLVEHRWSYPAFELGSVLAAMGRPVEAVEVFESLLRGEYGEVTGEARTNIEIALESARPRIARIVIAWRGASEPIVRIDGAVVENARNGAALDVDPGRHIVALETDSARTERTVDVGAGEAQSLEIDLVRERDGRLHIESDPAATIVVAGVGSAEGSFDHAVPPGAYEVTVTLDDEILEESVEVAPGRRTSLRLEPDGGVSPWLWVGISAGAVAVAAVVIAIVLATAASLPIDDIGT